MNAPECMIASGSGGGCTGGGSATVTEMPGNSARPLMEAPSLVGKSAAAGGAARLLLLWGRAGSAAR